MATFLGNGAKVTVNSVDLSAYVSSVTINQEFDQLEVTAMGDSGHKYIAGLENSSISIDFNADFATSKVNQTINGSGAGNGLVGTTTTVVIQPFTTPPTGADNPKYTATCLITQWPQVYNVGELATISVTWPVSGAVVKTIV
jgi:hypothetical protein